MIVVGAGLSGLVCARRLVAAGAKVIVLEARDRVGGRLHTGHVGGALVDLGGAWMTPGQPRLAALAAELGVATVAHDRTGRVLLDEPATSWLAGARAAFAQWRAMKRIERMARVVGERMGVGGASLRGGDAMTSMRSGESMSGGGATRSGAGDSAHGGDATTRGGDATSSHAGDSMRGGDATTSMRGGESMRGGDATTSPVGDALSSRTRTGDALALDDISLGAWLANHVRDPIARDRIRLHADLVFACDPADLSLLYYLRTLRATMGFAPERGAEVRFDGGAQTLATRLADGLDIQLGHPVRTVDDLGAGPIVLAMPPIQVARLLGRPTDVAMGRVVKCFAAYKRAFWRDDGWSGELYQPQGSVRATVEISREPPVLLAFVVGAEAARWSTRDPAERRADVLAAFARFGNAEPLDYLEVDWGADPWSGGCVAALPPRAGGTVAREPVGRIHIAGTETADRWPGYMEGAIESGERSAAEVLASK